MRRLLAVLALGLCAGCWDMGRGADAHIPGTELGTYRVLGTLVDATCGAGAAGSPDTWEFAVKLSKLDDELYWLNGREAIPGRIAADGVSFAFDTRVEVDIAPAGGGSDGCRMLRGDQASGKLSSATLDVASFAGRLQFSYAPAEGADCSTLIGVAGGFERLPCEMSYDLEAQRAQVTGK